MTQAWGRNHLPRWEKAISETTQSQKDFLFPKPRVEALTIYQAVGWGISQGFFSSIGRKLTLEETATLVPPHKAQKEDSKRWRYDQVMKTVSQETAQEYFQDYKKCSWSSCIQVKERKWLSFQATCISEPRKSSGREKVIYQWGAARHIIILAASVHQ